MSALNLRSNTGQQMRCPHAWCSGTDYQTLTHIVWECAAARRIWRLVHQQWTRRPVRLDVADSIRHSLGPTAPVLAREIRHRLSADGDDTDKIAMIQRTTWRSIQSTVPHQLWLHRNAAAFNGAAASVHSIAAKIWTTISNQLRAHAAAQRLASNTHDAGRLLDLLMTNLDTDDPVEPAATHEARLYYDGGARGNPGTSGAGSLLLERRQGSATWQIVWWSAAYLGEHNINNVAEHTALQLGLTEAAKRYGSTKIHLHVIGDSMLVTRQLTGLARVGGKFTTLVHRSRQALLQLYNYDFLHTLRSGNKSADLLANTAMDSRLTLTSQTAELAVYHSIMTSLDATVPSDTVHDWTETNTTTNVQTAIEAQLMPAQPANTACKRPRPISIHPERQGTRRPPRPP